MTRAKRNEMKRAAEANKAALKEKRNHNGSNHGKVPLRSDLKPGTRVRGGIVQGDGFVRRYN